MPLFRCTFNERGAAWPCLASRAGLWPDEVRRSGPTAYCFGRSELGQVLPYFPGRNQRTFRACGDGCGQRTGRYYCGRCWGVPWCSIGRWRAAGGWEAEVARVKMKAGPRCFFRHYAGGKRRPVIGLRDRVTDWRWRGFRRASAANLCGLRGPGEQPAAHCCEEPPPARFDELRPAEYAALPWRTFLRARQLGEAEEACGAELRPPRLEPRMPGGRGGAMKPCMRRRRLVTGFGVARR